MGCYSSLVLMSTFTTWTFLQQHFVQSQRIGEFRLRGCSGSLEVYRNTLLGGESFHDICDGNFGDEEAQVACRQVGCNPVGARRTSSGPGFGFITFVREGYSCSGSESSLSSCQRTSTRCTVGSTITSENQGQFVTISCGPSPPSEPRDLQVEAVSASALNVTWNRPQSTNNGGSVTMYQILLNTRVVATLNVDIRTSFRQQNYLIRNLVENTTYMVQVKGSNNEGFGPAATATAITQSLTLPQRILDDPKVENRGPRVFVSWEYPGGTVNNYIIEYNRVFDTEVTPVSVNGTETSTYIDDLMPGLYQLKIAVENDNGISAFGSTISFLVLDIVIMETTSAAINGNNAGNNNGVTTTAGSFPGLESDNGNNIGSNNGNNIGSNNGVTTTAGSMALLLVCLFTLVIIEI